MSQILDNHERRNPVLAKVAAYLATRLTEHREANDHPQDTENTAFLRGRIAELKHIQDLLATGES
jgi:hypothetical protein